MNRNIFGKRLMDKRYVFSVVDDIFIIILFLPRFPCTQKHSIKLILALIKTLNLHEKVSSIMIILFFFSYLR